MNCLIKQSFLIEKVIHCFKIRTLKGEKIDFRFFQFCAVTKQKRLACEIFAEAVRVGQPFALGVVQHRRTGLPRPTVAASKATPRPDTIPARRPLILPILNDVSLRHKNAGNVIWERPAYTTETKLLDFSKWKITNSPAYSLSDDMMAIIYTPATVYATPMNIYFHFYYQEIKIVAVHRVI